MRSYSSCSYFLRIYWYFSIFWLKPKRFFNLFSISIVQRFYYGSEEPYNYLSLVPDSTGVCWGVIFRLLYVGSLVFLTYIFIAHSCMQQVWYFALFQVETYSEEMEVDGFFGCFGWFFKWNCYRIAQPEGVFHSKTTRNPRIEGIELLISIQANVLVRNGKTWEEVCVNLGKIDKINSRIIKMLVKEISIFVMSLVSLGVLSLGLQSLALHKLYQKETYSKQSSSSWSVT